jgi:hypothetical protein
MRIAKILILDISDLIEGDKDNLHPLDINNLLSLSYFKWGFPSTWGTLEDVEVEYIVIEETEGG